MVLKENTLPRRQHQRAAVSIKSDPSMSPTPMYQQCPSQNSSTHCISRERYHQTCSSC
jgi:hypothetical protein